MYHYGNYPESYYSPPKNDSGYLFALILVLFILLVVLAIPHDK